jgi:hypothetical protein
MRGYHHKLIQHTQLHFPQAKVTIQVVSSLHLSDNAFENLKAARERSVVLFKELPVVAYLDDFKKTSGLLGACGHYIRELDSAITVADNAFEDLKEARERSVALFKEEDLSLPTDELNHKEAKAARLQ